MFHTSLLSPYKQTEVHGPNYTSPPPDLINEEEYEVEAIITHQKCGTGYQYLLKWKGYGSNDNLWEPECNLGNAAEVLLAYKTRRKL